MCDAAQSPGKYNRKKKVRILILVHLLLCFTATSALAITSTQEIERANQLSERAVDLFQEEKYQEAIVFFEQALAIHERVLGREHRDNITPINNLADLYKTTGQYNKALSLYQRVRVISEKAYGAEHEDTVPSLNNLANVYEVLGQYDQALQVYQRALAIREKVLRPEHLYIAMSLNNLGTLYRTVGQYDIALPLFQRSLAISKKVYGSDHTFTATNITNVASILNQQGKYREAIPLIQESLAIREKILGPNHRETAESLNNLAWMYKALGEYNLALPLFQRSLAIFEKTLGSEHQDIASNLSNLGALYTVLGEYDKALSMHLRALAIREKVLGPAHISTSDSLNELAVLYGILGQHENALPLLKRSLSITERIFGPERAETATSLNNLALQHKEIGQHDQAMPLYQRALMIRKNVFGPEHPVTANSLNNLASLYYTLGQYDQALPLFQQALTIREKSLSSRNSDVGESLNNLAVLYETLGQFEQALPLFQRALSIAEKNFGSEHKETAVSLNNLALLYDTMGQYDKAQPLYMRALLIREKVLGETHAETAISLNNLATLHSNNDQPALALPLYQRALRISGLAHVPDIQMFIQQNLGSVYAAQSNPATAIFYLKGAVNTMQSIRSESRGLDKGLQKSLLKKNEAVYKKLAKLLVSAGRLAEAQQVLSMLKEDEYFDFIRRDSKSDTRGTRVNYSGAERPYAEMLDKLGNDGATLVDQLNALNKQAKLGLSIEHEQKRTNIKVQLAKQENQTIALVNDIAQQLPAAQQKQLAQQRAEQALLAAGVQKQLAQLGQGVTLIQYMLLGDKIQILLTDSKQQIVREAPLGEAALYPKLVALRRALENPHLDPRPLAQELYQSLIAPIESDIKESQTLMLSLDGALRYIPFSALYDGQHYFIERYPLAIYTAAAKDKLAPAATPKWKISGLGVTQEHPGFSALPGVKAELSGILGQQGIPGEIHLDQAFTARQMQTSLKQGNPVLHLATHFQFTPGTEADSYLLLGDGSHLSLKDIRQGDYPFGQLELLTLSACATAMHGGQETDGKEVEGFGALAQNKGAKGVLATLWPIVDASTAQLMQTLYRGHQQQYLTKAEALRQAQLALLKGGNKAIAPAKPDERGARRVTAGEQSAAADIPFQADAATPFAHPFFWAPFILMGNWL